MENNDILPFDLFNRFFGFGKRANRGLFGDTTSLFRDFDNMHKEMNRLFDVFNNLSTNAPKELVIEYKTSDGNKVQEIGPIVYGYSMTIGPDGKPHVREFGNVKDVSANAGQYLGMNKPQITPEREPLADVTTTDKEVKVVLEMPGMKKEDIKINAYDGKVEVKTAEATAKGDTSVRKYHKIIDLPKSADIETARSIYNNGILEVTFDKKKEESKPKGKDIKIE
ncbi:MAG TPA: archaeal heat shock protein Hsp20 [Verrucomicrobiae bacterium]|nr:archaeal heat shock protein Hsp20 [Verrucomicrobiae bacterium]